MPIVDPPAQSQSQGPSTDRNNAPVIDPTANVIAILVAAVTRQDDLRAADVRRLDDMASLRAHYDELLAKKESERIDAIRAVDVAAVQRSAEDAATRANTLAAQVSTAADVVRTTLTTALEPIQKDIQDLRRVQYEAQGQKTQVVEGRAGTGAIYAFVGAALAFVGVATAIIVAVAK